MNNSNSDTGLDIEMDDGVSQGLIVVTPGPSEVAVKEVGSS